MIRNQAAVDLQNSVKFDTGTRARAHTQYIHTYIHTYVRTYSHSRTNINSSFLAISLTRSNRSFCN